MSQRYCPYIDGFHGFVWQFMVKVFIVGGTGYTGSNARLLLTSQVRWWSYFRSEAGLAVADSTLTSGHYIAWR